MAAGAQQGLLAAPPGDVEMVAGEEHVGDRPALPDRGTGILRVFQQAGVMALLGEAALLREHAGHQAGHAVHQSQGGQLTAGEHIVAHGNLLVHQGIKHPLVHPLVVAAENAEAGKLRQFLGPLLG